MRLELKGGGDFHTTGISRIRTHRIKSYIKQQSFMECPDPDGFTLFCWCLGHPRGIHSLFVPRTGRFCLRIQGRTSCGVGNPRHRKACSVGQRPQSTRPIHTPAPCKKGIRSIEPEKTCKVETQLHHRVSIRFWFGLVTKPNQTKPNQNRTELRLGDVTIAAHTHPESIQKTGFLFNPQ